ncbi:MAG: LamG domain-containing protein [Hyphomicrobiales bacterium]|nr:MAG: LamG domain-containing protein [Hyphomicrobiales bacterium]
MKPAAALRMRQQSSGGGGSDPFFSSVVALLHMDGTNGSTTFTDQKGHTFSAGGSAALTTAQQKFGTASLDLNGTNAYITTPTSTDWDFGSGDFTIEAWVRITAAQRGAIYHRGTSAQLYLEIEAGRTLRLLANSGTYVVASTALIALNTWTHVAGTRNGGFIDVFVGGVKQSPVAISGSINASTDPMRIGADVVNARRVAGQIDDVRVTKGVCRYTATFTPPAAPFPDS